MSNGHVLISHAISTKADGSMKLADGTNDFENIKKFLLAKKLSPQFIRMDQTHSGNVQIVTEISELLIHNTDGLITRAPNLSLTIVTADCLPLLFSDNKKQVIGAVHAGWRGLAQDIIHTTVEIFKEKFGSNPHDISVIVGPSIEQTCYEVGSEIIDVFSKFSWFDKTCYTESKKGHYFLDLKKMALHCFLKEGILKEHISVSQECTRCSTENYYSHRRGDMEGRFLSAICLV